MTRTVEVTEKMLAQSREKTHETFGNEILYEMCAKNPRHTDPCVIASKMWLIGRAYSAAIERRRPRDNKPLEPTRELYCKISNEIISARIDSDLDELPDDISTDKIDNTELFHKALKVHNKFINIIYKITKTKNISFSSKYLHFHKPDCFFIYDSIVSSNIKKLCLYSKFEIIKNNNEYCKEYYEYCNAALNVKIALEKGFSLPLAMTLRQFDTLLYYINDK